MLPSRGRPGKIFLMEVDRELTAQDIFRAATLPTAKVAAPSLQRLKASHHTMARLIAGGRSAIEVATLTNKTPQRVRDLERDDPAFRELVSYYQNQIADAGIDHEQRIQEKLRNVGELALDEIQERLEDDAKIKVIPTSELRQIMGDALSRTVAPQKTAQPIQNSPTKITFNMGPKKLTPVIEGEFKVEDDED